MRRHNDRGRNVEPNGQETSASDGDERYVESLWQYDDGEKVLLLSECDPDTGLLQDRRENDRWMESDTWMEVEQ